MGSLRLSTELLQRGGVEQRRAVEVPKLQYRTGCDEKDFPDPCATQFGRAFQALFGLSYTFCAKGANDNRLSADEFGYRAVCYCPPDSRGYRTHYEGEWRGEPENLGHR